MRVIAFITILYLAINLPFGWAIPFVALYLVWWQGYEVIMLGVLIDAYFGVTTDIPYYTLMTTALVALFAWLRPQLIFYNQL